MSGAYAGALRCPRCGRDADEAAAFELCGPCTEQGQHVNHLPVYDLSRIAPGWARDDRQPGIFRYRDLLPVGASTRPVSLGEGGTPLLPLTRITQRVGAAAVYLKDESRNPTWSYKDRLAAVGLTKAREDGCEVVVVSSTGNHGAAVAAYAAAAGIRCVVLTLESVPLTMKVLMQSFGAHVVALASAPERWTVMREAIRAHGWMPMSGFVNPPAGSNPFAVDGYKTMAYEIVEDLGDAPDVVVTPVAYGDGIVGLYRGFLDLVALGAASRVPRLVAAEVFGPYAKAAASGEPGSASAVAAGPSVAFSIATPLATFQGHRAMTASGGTSVATSSDRDILAAQALLAREEGIYLEASSALTIAALDGLHSRGELGGDDVVVCIGTSTGLKDIAATASTLAPVPVIAPTLAALEATMPAAP
ncbi:MAG: threonine synthase [Pseudonocardiales bacterium]|nr:threonine synthase [Pseudonocardiales bacterium]